MITTKGTNIKWVLFHWLILISAFSQKWCKESSGTKSINILNLDSCFVWHLSIYIRLFLVSWRRLELTSETMSHYSRNLNLSTIRVHNHISSHLQWAPYIKRRFHCKVQVMNFYTLLPTNCYFSGMSILWIGSIY